MSKNNNLKNVHLKNVFKVKFELIFYTFFSQNTSFFIKHIDFILLVDGRNPRNLYPPTNIWKCDPTILKMSETWESPIIQISHTQLRFCRIPHWVFNFLWIFWPLNFQYLRIHTSEKMTKLFTDLCLSGLNSYMK